MDDRSLFRYRPGYAAHLPDTALDWSAWGGFAGAVEMCNNNGACRKTSGVMCPSFKATRDEQHLTRGRANALRLAISGQLGPDALTSEALRETLDLCIGCKGCRRECPTGVDMTRMKTEFLHHYRHRHGVPWRERLIAHLPAYAPWVARFGPLLGLRDRVPGLAALSQSLFDLTARRPLPKWRGNGAEWRGGAEPATADVVLLVDTFDRYFEPENVRAALAVLEAGGYRVAIAGDGGVRPLCCGRTYLAAGLIERARTEARRTLAALEPFIACDVPVIGIEPACLLTLRDEFTALLPGPWRPSRSAPQAPRGTSGAGARPLPPKGVRRNGGGHPDAGAGSRPRGRGHRSGLLRHGRRLRL
jgi:Fe-S oxidoreductase